MRRREFLGLAGAAVASTLAGSLTSCGSAGSAGSGPIKIGLVVHKTGPYADTGRMMSMGAKLAVDAINSAGGIKSLGGNKIQLVEEDAGATVESAISAMNRALSQGIIAGVGTGISSATIAITELAERRKITWTDVAFADELTDRGFKYTFATSPKTSEFTNLFSEAIDTLAQTAHVDVTRIGIIAGINDVAVQAAKEIKSTYADKYGWSVVLDETVPEGSLKDAAPLVSKIASSQPQLLFVGPAISDIALISKGQVQQGMTPVPWVLSGAPFLSGAFVDALGAKAANGTFAVAASGVYKGESRKIADKIRAAGDDYPQEYHLSTYAEFFLLADAMERAKSRDSTKIRDAMAETDMRGGPASVWPAQRMRFDEDGRAVDRQAALVQWQQTKTVTVYPEQLATGKTIWPTLA
ncbi:ABC transporter substrate-binding protein [Nocardioides cheoyonin]|uniref:ABC transporter substrate-binding protein n=1 Tax=Nocardioides cheoyonin TaxID=3156615 RepID=UPI0032B40B15